MELKVTELKKEHIGQIQIYMNYIDKTPKGLVTSKNVVKLYDIVQPRKSFWKDKLAIITDVKNDMIYCRIIENGMDMCFAVKDILFVNHNTKTAAKAYFDLCEKMKEKLKEITDKIRRGTAPCVAKAVYHSVFVGRKIRITGHIHFIICIRTELYHTAPYFS